MVPYRGFKTIENWLPKISLRFLGNKPRILRSLMHNKHPVMSTRYLDFSVWWKPKHVFLILEYNQSKAPKVSFLRRQSTEDLHVPWFYCTSIVLNSGLLVSYLSLRHMEKNNGQLSLFNYYFHRFWRWVNSRHALLFDLGRHRLGKVKFEQMQPAVFLICSTWPLGWPPVVLHCFKIHCFSRAVLSADLCGSKA